MTDTQQHVASATGHTPTEAWDYYVPPRWLVEHPELKARDITPCTVLKPGYVYRTDRRNKGIPQYAIKMITLPGSEEADIYDSLTRRGRISSTHTLPGIVLRTENLPPVVVLPLITDLMDMYDDPTQELPNMLRHFAQMIAGVANLHRLHIAHLDICYGNMLLAQPQDLEFHAALEFDKVYIIDFGGARQLQLGPGHQPAIDLPGSQIRKPIPSMKRFDPYAWDMYCVGMTFDMLAHYVSTNRHQPTPWILQRYITWVIGEERGCESVCRCRPSARRALLVLTLIRGIVHVSGFFERLTKSIVGFARRSRAVSL
ncbi:hypothetical protein K466DRAFT_520895 [Polyporus arcularius HHB13444]|uniref:Protein kinase domain-containing protein n=1 Tax=Polyporus arcularius HHB13444 TaxID=1314778 RepID=A0A5C3PQL8_9APHY|nr:hypothetical protein K466DRAFT_520895 [Polyporus arcularius HHB13444]